MRSQISPTRPPSAAVTRSRHCCSAPPLSSDSLMSASTASSRSSPRVVTIRPPRADPIKSICRPDSPAPTRAPLGNLSCACGTGACRFDGSGRGTDTVGSLRSGRGPLSTHHTLGLFATVHRAQTCDTIEFNLRGRRSVPLPHGPASRGHDSIRRDFPAVPFGRVLLEMPLLRSRTLADHSAAGRG